jgi:ubiquitin carboxyl-terminal hydrolase 22/27/51
MYSGSKEPFAPSTFLKLVWTFCRGLAGYEQQDSHEFLVSLLELLHGHLADRQFGCDCVVHGIFSGVLESSVTCGHCGAVNAVFDPFMDISLEIPAKHKGVVSLLHCLAQFTCPETLSSGSYVCATCNSSDCTAVKQFRFRKLPKTLIIHLKVLFDY